MIVLDASVAVKWYLPESGRQAALDVYECEERLVAPALIRIEVAGAISRSARNKLLPVREAQACYALWQSDCATNLIHFIENEALIDHAVEWSLRLLHPLADCLYLAAAAEYKAPLITADATLAKRAEGTGVEVRVLESKQ